MQPRYNHVAGAMTSDDVPYQVWPRLRPIAPGLFGDVRGDTIWIVGKLLDPPSPEGSPLEFGYCDIDVSVPDIQDRIERGWTRGSEHRVQLAPGILGDRVSDGLGRVWILAQYLRVSEELGFLDHLEIRRQVDPGVMSVLAWHIQMKAPLGLIDW